MHDDRLTVSKTYKSLKRKLFKFLWTIIVCFVYIISWLSFRDTRASLSFRLFFSYVFFSFSFVLSFAQHTHILSFGTLARMLLSTRSLTYLRDKKIWGIKMYHVTTTSSHRKRGKLRARPSRSGEILDNSHMKASFSSL